MKRFMKVKPSQQIYTLDQVLNICSPDKTVFSTDLSLNTIHHVLMRLLQWALLYNGILVPSYDGEWDVKKYPFQQGANLLGVNRRTLDDYWLNVQRGFITLFNFE